MTNKPKGDLDWSKIMVDTKILVRDSDHEKWRRRYFAKFDGGLVFAWTGGTTSFSAGYAEDTISWRQAVLYERDENLGGER